MGKWMNGMNHVQRVLLIVVGCCHESAVRFFIYLSCGNYLIYFFSIISPVIKGKIVQSCTVFINVIKWIIIHPFEWLIIESNPIPYNDIGIYFSIFVK